MLITGSAKEVIMLTVSDPTVSLDVPGVLDILSAHAPDDENAVEAI